METMVCVAALTVVLAPCIYVCAASVMTARLPTLRNKRICLLIAHPDDEAMFFAPTVQALTRPETGNHVKILCLSTGDADGLGQTRKRELLKSARLLGLRNDEDVHVVDNPDDFPDSMTVKWDESKIVELLCRAVAQHLLPGLAKPGGGGGKTKRQQPKPEVNMDVLITFDGEGVSSHPNHTSLYHGARAFIAALLRGSSPDDATRCPVDLYTLTTVNVARKYTAMGDVVATLVLWALGGGDDRRTDEEDHDHPDRLLFLSGLAGSDGATLRTAWRAMTEAHASQMRWFRYGWIVLSRYMLINDLRLEKVKTG